MGVLDLARNPRRADRTARDAAIEVFGYDEPVSPNAIEVNITACAASWPPTARRSARCAGSAICSMPIEARAAARWRCAPGCSRRCWPMLAIAVLLGLAGATLIADVVRRTNDRVLGGALGAVAETVQVERAVTLDLPAAAFGMLENSERDNVYYRIAVVAPPADRLRRSPRRMSRNWRWNRPLPLRALSRPGISVSPRCAARCPCRRAGGGAGGRDP
jgi:hypothetical protein